MLNSLLAGLNFDIENLTDRVADFEIEAERKLE